MVGVFGVRICSVVIAMAAVAGFAGPAQAATVVGSPLTAADAGSDTCSNTGVCTQWNDLLPGATLTTPAGVVTGFSVRSAVAIQARIRVLRGPSTATLVVASSPFASVPGTNTAEEFDARLAVNAGDVVALGLPSGADFPFAVTGGATGRCFNPFLPEPADGATQLSANCSGGREFLYNATVEPDADGDGYGDESQDACPTNAATFGNCPVADPPPARPPAALPDTEAPLLTGVSLSDRVFRVSKSSVGALIDTPHGTDFRFSLSEAATATFTIQQQFDGRRVNGDCRKPTSGNRKRGRCVRYVPVRTFARAAATGENSVAFMGWIRVRGVSRALREARYRALIKARDAAGNVSAERETAFRVVE